MGSDETAMGYSNERLNSIYDRTDGRCHLCGKRLAFKNYGNLAGARGAWEVEHSVPKAAGGTERLNNLYAACISCNREKGSRPTKSVRAKNGRSAAPLSAEKKRQARTENAILGGTIGGVLGLVGGPVGAAAGASLGALLGGKLEVE